MTEEARLSDLDLAALLCSRVCHDVISPVGAIANGLELFDDPEMDPQTKQTALDMVRSSAIAASAKLKFCRIAFGAAGSAGSIIDMSEAGETAKAFVGHEKVKLEWNAPAENRPKQQVKLLLNMVLLAIASIPRGGVIQVQVKGNHFEVRAKGDRAKLPEAICSVLDKKIDPTTLDARLIQPYYAVLLAQSAQLTLSMTTEGDDILVQAM